MILELLYWMFMLAVPFGAWIAWNTPHDAVAAWCAVVVEVGIWWKLAALRARRRRLWR